ncbi:hypothetical protein BAY13_17345 [Elizabethkingia bruuniana]|uniref:MoaF-related domain-containing protein n=1 Tax=Elizabethkingia bruuniana TaxID=1756149 RepID=UPI00099B0178|nr:hypothetical protein [Elizabethkingia bruuniana]OPC66496.1 hypothetical protein BAY13_17345 [Elizabethkingia bruuniana]
MKKIVFIIVITSTIFAACSRSEVAEKISDTEYELIGRKAVLTYPDFKAEMSYLTDSTLYWKTTRPNNITGEGNEKIVFKKLSNHQYFLSWIEQSGFTISQVIDTKAKTVTAFGSFADENSNRGQRSGIGLEGSFEFVK